MVDDILDPIPPSDQPTHKKPRWHQVVITNAEGPTDKTLIAQGQRVPVRLDDDGAAVRIKGDAERDQKLDLTIRFDPLNPDHMALLVLMDKVIKAAYAQKLADQAAQETAYAKKLADQAEQDALPKS